MRVTIIEELAWFRDVLKVLRRICVKDFFGLGGDISSTINTSLVISTNVDRSIGQ